MSLQLHIPESRIPSEVMDLLEDASDGPHYFVFTETGSRVHLNKASAADIKRTISELAADFKMSDEALEATTVRLAVVAGAINRAVARSTGLFGGQEFWDKIAPWYRPSYLVEKGKKKK